MEPPKKLLEQIEFDTRRKIEDHMLMVIDKYTHEEKSSQPLQTISKQFEIAVTFLTRYNGNFNVENKKKFISQYQLMMLISIK